MIFGISAMTMGINSVILMQNMPPVILACILGTILGMLFRLGSRINAACGALQRLIGRFIKPAPGGMEEDEFQALFLTTVVLFCASGTGIYGSIVSGMTGEHSILLAKSILDLFTALIFACSLGPAVSVIALPQLVIFLALFYCSGLILPLTTEGMIADFKACGGILLLATGFRMLKLKMFPVADMIPAMILAMPFSWIWTAYVLPLVS